MKASLALAAVVIVASGCSPQPDYDAWDAWVVASPWDDADGARDVGDAVCESTVDEVVRFLDDVSRDAFDRFSEQFGALDENGETNYMVFAEGATDLAESEGVDVFEQLGAIDAQAEDTVLAAGAYLCPSRNADLQEAVRLARLPFAER